MAGVTVVAGGTDVDAGVSGRVAGLESVPAVATVLLASGPACVTGAGATGASPATLLATDEALGEGVFISLSRTRMCLGLSTCGARKSWLPCAVCESVRDSLPAPSPGRWNLPWSLESDKDRPARSGGCSPSSSEGVGGAELVGVGRGDGVAVPIVDILVNV